MSEAPRPARVPSEDAVSPDVLPDEPLEIVFADELSLEKGADPEPDPAPLPSEPPDKPGDARLGPEVSAS